MVTTQGEPETAPVRISALLTRHLYEGALVLAALAIGFAPVPFASIGAAALLVVAFRR